MLSGWGGRSRFLRGSVASIYDGKGGAYQLPRDRRVLLVLRSAVFQVA